MNDKSSDNFARVIAIVSLVVALLAIFVPYFQQRNTLEQQNEQFEALQQEELSVELNPYVAEKIYLTQINFEPLGHVVQIPWELTVSNSGHRQLSITKYDLLRTEPSGITSYSGIDGGLLTKESKSVNLPLTLEPGETKIFFLLVGVTVPQDVYNTLKVLNSGKPVQYSEATTALSRIGVDLYGNKLEYEELEGGGYHSYVDTENQKAQKFRCTIHTGRNNTFVVSASKY